MMDDAQVNLRHDVQAVFEQEVVVFINRASQSVFNWNQAIARRTARDAVENGGESLLREDANPPAEQFVGGLFAERSSLALKSIYGISHGIHFSKFSLDEGAMLPRECRSANCWYSFRSGSS